MSEPDFSSLFVPASNAPKPSAPAPEPSGSRRVKPLLLAGIGVLIGFLLVFGLIKFASKPSATGASGAAKVSPAELVKVGEVKDFPGSTKPAWTHQIGEGGVFSGSPLGLVSVADGKFCLYEMSGGKEQFCKPLDAPVSFTTATRLDGELRQIWVSGTKLFWDGGSVDLPDGAKIVAQGSGLGVVDGGQTSLIVGGKLASVATPGTLLGVGGSKAYSASGFEVSVSAPDGSLTQLKVDAPSRGLEFSRWLGMSGDYLVGLWSGDGGLVVATYDLDGKKVADMPVANDYASANLEYSSGRNLGIFGGVVIDSADGQLYGPFNVSGSAVGGFVPVSSGADTLWWSKDGAYPASMTPAASSLDGSHFLTSQANKVSGWSAGK